MTTANWLTILVTLATSATTLIAIAVKWGGVLVRLAAAETAVAGLARGHEKRGERLGVVEERVAAIEGSMAPLGATAPKGRVRSRTRPGGVEVVEIGDYGKRRGDLDPPPTRGGVREGEFEDEGEGDSR